MFPWSNKKEESTALSAHVDKPTELALTNDKDQDVVVYQGHPGKPHSTMVHVRSKPLKVGGKIYNVDAKQLIRMIRQVTQTIGEYKERDNIYAGYVIGALRKCRSDMVSDLETHFGIHWEIDESCGQSIFYM